MAKKIIFIVVGILLVFASGFGTSEIIAKRRATRSVDRLEQLLGTGKQSTEDLYRELESRIKELDGFRETAAQIDTNIGECLNIAEQAGLTIRQLRGTVEELGATSSSIGDILKQLREGQSAIKQYVGELERDNSKLKEELRRIQGSFGEQ